MVEERDMFFFRNGALIVFLFQELIFFLARTISRRPCATLPERILPSPMAVAVAVGWCRQRLYT